MHLSNFIGISAVATTAAIIFNVPSPAVAAVTVDFRSNGTTGPVASSIFTNGSIQLTATGVNAPQDYVTASTTSGLCLFANTSDGVNRCGLLNQRAVPQNYNKVGISSNVAGTYTGFNISQVLIDGFINPNPPGTGQLFVKRGTAAGPLLETIELSSTPLGSTVNFSTPIEVDSGEFIVFQASGSNSSIRLGSLDFQEVPGPLPVLGAGAAFGWSRRIRRRINVAQDIQS